MIPNPAIRNLIREDKVHQIYSQMQVGQEKYGMQTLNQSLYNLWPRRIISPEEAHGPLLEPDELRMMMEKGTNSPAANRVAPRDVDGIRRRRDVTNAG